MKTIDELDLQGKRVLIRVDFNVPLNENFQITDLTRIKAAEKTIRKILDSGASVIIMSHLGRPKDGPEDRFSLKHLISELEDRFDTEVLFSNDCIGTDAWEMSSAIQPGQILLLENLRFYKEETKGDVEFAQKLSKHADIYINDAFGTAHRAHASTSIIAQFFKEKAAGYVMAAEIKNADKILKNADKPFTAIMGGAKISDKILIVERLLNVVDNLIIGGGMSYTFTKAKGGSIGTSICEEDKLDLALSLIEKAKEKGVNLIFPTDTVQADAFKNDAKRKVVPYDQIDPDYMGLDIGPQSIESFSKAIEGSKTILWNGPMGVFEFENFAAGTMEIAESVVRATKKGGFSLIGGGDSAAAINNLGYGNQVSYVSTGGGALLEYMEGKVLPGVEALD